MESISPEEIRLFHEPQDRLRLTVAGRFSVPTVIPAWAAPLSQPKKYLSLLNFKHEEVTLISSTDVLDEASRNAVQIELDRRYLTSIIEAIESAKVEFGATYWTVRTHRGRRDLVTQSLQENAQWLGEEHLLLIDVDGNRFEIPDVTKLDAVSRDFLDSIL